MDFIQFDILERDLNEEEIEMLGTPIDIQKEVFSMMSARLMYAAREGHLHNVEVLAEEMSPNHIDKMVNDCTALYFAVSNGHFEIVKCLLSKGASVNYLFKDGMNLLMRVVRSFSASVEMVELLIRHGADAQTLDGNGWSVLHWAAFMGRWDLCDYLIRHNSSLAQKIGGETLANIARKREWNVVADRIERLIDELCTEEKRIGKEEE